MSSNETVWRYNSSYHFQFNFNFLEGHFFVVDLNAEQKKLEKQRWSVYNGKRLLNESSFFSQKGEDNLRRVHREKDREREERNSQCMV